MFLDLFCANLLFVDRRNLRRSPDSDHSPDPMSPQHYETATGVGGASTPLLAGTGLKPHPVGTFKPSHDYLLICERR